jgi:hypothetical protein
MGAGPDRIIEQAHLDADSGFGRENLFQPFREGVGAPAEVVKVDGVARGFCRSRSCLRRSRCLLKALTSRPKRKQMRCFSPRRLRERIRGRNKTKPGGGGLGDPPAVRINAVPDVTG